MYLKASIRRVGTVIGMKHSGHSGLWTFNSQAQCPNHVVYAPYKHLLFCRR